MADRTTEHEIEELRARYPARDVEAYEAAMDAWAAGDQATADAHVADIVDDELRTWAESQVAKPRGLVEGS